MLRVCSLRGFTATSIGWRRRREEPRQVTIFSELGALRAIIGTAIPSARCHIITSAPRIDPGAANHLPSALFPSSRNLQMRKSVRQPGGAQ